MDIPISLKVFHQLIGAAQKTGYQKEDWEIAAEAIDEWMQRHDPDTLAMPAATGYQWKKLFPNGSTTSPYLSAAAGVSVQTSALSAAASH
jgi:hypothetical protein